MRRLAPAVGLFLLAPFVGEYLLGNLTVDELGVGIVLAPMYGFGALLVRELGRRRGGWPTIVVLAAAYALLEEGPVDQLLWNTAYSGGHNYLAGSSYLPALGTSVELIQTILALHLVWSVCVPIAIVETFVSDRRSTPWLGRFGLTLTAVLFALGAALVFWGHYAESGFVAAPAHQAWAVAAIVALVLLALVPRRRTPPTLPGRAPSPWLVGALGLVGTSAYWAPSVLVTADWYEWVGVAVWFVVAAAGVTLVARWSRRRDWGQPHHFALAAGATLTYVWTAFPNRPEAGGPLTVDLISNAVFGTLALALLTAAARRCRSEHPARSPA
ncbi:hypothetical protein [Pseudonocardia acaciae]|uniref:hypothetical protein n=1 Tax=Pseudonocardia acaciae TaxID=551276 RepID=UPI00055D1B2E|nr:hypothetical protein [Pseudonocardia acaciae]